MIRPAIYPILLHHLPLEGKYGIISQSNGLLCLISQSIGLLSQSIGLISQSIGLLSQSIDLISQSIGVARDCVLEQSQESADQFLGEVGFRMGLRLAAFVGDKDLFLVSCPDNVALRADSDEVVLAEVLADQAHFPDLGDDVPDVDVLLGNGLDDFVIVALKVFNVFALHAVLYEVVVSLHAELRELLLSLPLLQLENVWQFLLLAVALQNAFPLILSQPTAFLVEPPFVVVEDAQVFDHLPLVVVVPQHHCQFETLPSVSPTFLVVLDDAIEALNLDADSESELLEIKLTAVVLAEDVVLDLSLEVPLTVQTAQLIEDQVEGQVHQSVAETLAQNSLQLLKLHQQLLGGETTKQGHQALHLLANALPLLRRNQLNVVDQTLLQVVEAVFDLTLVLLFAGTAVLVVEVGCPFPTGAGPGGRPHGPLEPIAVATARSAALLVFFEELLLGPEHLESEVPIVDERGDLLELKSAQFHLSKQRILGRNLNYPQSRIIIKISRPSSPSLAGRSSDSEKRSSEPVSPALLPVRSLPSGPRLDCRIARGPGPP